MQDFIDPKDLLLKKIRARGGFVNAHAHIDRAYILNKTNYKLTSATLQQKWDFPDQYKAKASVGDIYSNMARVVESMCAQGVQAIGSFIDVDPVVKDKAILASQKLRDNFKKDIKIVFINQVVKGVIEPEAKRWFEIGAQYADIIGGLLEKDKGREAEHLDILFQTAKKNGKKLLHVHVDQFNSPRQRDTELLVKKTLEHGYEGKVTAIHCLSVAAQPKAYRQKLYKQMKKADIKVVACPVAWIDSPRSEVLAPSHNAVTPVDEMVAAGLSVGLGTDNISDIYKPFNDGDMWTELHFLLEACHIYDIDTLSDIASVNGLKTLGL
jgi:cytosine/adenosine deaminase-related metal-dependent hydrolase